MNNILKSAVIAGLFLIPCIALYVENSLIYPAGTSKGFAFRIIVEILFSGWLILALYDPQYRPKISGIVLSFALLLLVMLVANALGADRYASFWSTLLRMDGYITLVHTFMYMLVLGTMFNSRQLWDWMLDITLAVAVLVACYGLFEYFTGDGSRLISTFGNPGYLAAYFLFHVFFALWMFVQKKRMWERLIYLSLSVLFMIVMFQTGTRGTAVGLLAGFIVLFVYITPFKVQSLNFRKLATAFSIVAVLCIGMYSLGTGKHLIQSDPRLARIANISVDALSDRFPVWNMAWQGIKDEPILGYGQDNYNYAYYKHYDSRLTYGERWFDRAHNIILDWWLAGGILGLLVYLSIFAWCAWYLLFRPAIKEEDNSFTAEERGVLLATLAAYFTQNQVTFDTNVSYICFALVLALITSRVGRVPEKVANLEINPKLVSRVFAPLVVVLLVVSISVLNIPGIVAAKELRNAYVEKDASKRLEAFQRAFDQNSFARQTIVEVLSTLGVSKVANDPKISREVKERYYALAKQQFKKLISERPNDARAYYYFADFYRIIDKPRKARKLIKLAREISPNNPSIIIFQGKIELRLKNFTESNRLFKTAFERNEHHLDARRFYVYSLLLSQRPHEAIKLLDSDRVKDNFANNDSLINVARHYSYTEFESELYAHRVYAKSNARYEWNKESENWTRLAYLYYKQGKKDDALRVLHDARQKFPVMKQALDCYISNVNRYRNLQAECSE